MQITVKEIKNNTALVEAVLSDEEVQAEKEHAVDELIQTVTVKGFRQGKAPKAIASEQIDPDKLSNHLLGHILNQLITKTMKENDFKLLGKPVLENIDSKDQKGWTVSLSFPLYPKLDVQNYQKYFSKTSKSKSTKSKEPSKENKVDKIYETLLKNFAVEIPPSVIEEEVKFSLDKLENQAKTLNLTLEKYLSAVKKTLEEIKSEYSKRADESIKLDLILLEISKLEKIDTSMEEIQEIAKVGSIPENQYPQLKNIIDRRKTIELLEKLC